MQYPGYVDPGGPSWREKARKVDYTGKLHLFTRCDIRANLPLNAALRAVLTFKTLSLRFIYLRALRVRDCLETNKYNQHNFAQMELYAVRTCAIHTTYSFPIKTSNIILNLILNFPLL